MTTKNRGIALMLTLVVAFFLVALLGAFLVVNRGNSALTASGMKRQAAYNACMTGLHFVWGELELNQAWGAGGFPNGVRSFSYPPVNPKLTVRIHGDRDNPEDLQRNYIEADVVGTRDSFRVSLVNNLQNRAVMDDTELGAIPGRSTRVKVEGYSGGVKLTLDSILRKRPFVDYSALANRNMSVELSDSPGRESAWRMRSKDPYVNQIRSNAEILGPSAIDMELLFKGPPRGGAAKASDDIILDGTSITSDPDFQALSERSSQGSFQVGSPEIDIPDLNQADLRFPEVSVSVPDGTLLLRPVVKHEWSSRDFDVDTSSPPDGTPDTTVTRWRLEQFQYQGIQHRDQLWVSETREALADSGELLSPHDGFPSPTSSEGFQDVPYQPTDFDDYPILYSQDSEHQMQANLPTGEIALTAGTRFDVDGQLEITHEDGAPQPNILFGFEMTGTGDSAFTAGALGSAAIEDPESNSAALIASHSLNIDGIASGFGSIFAEREVRLRAKSGLRAEPDMAVAVHGEQIRFEAEDPPGRDSQNVLLETDWELFKEAMNDQGYSSFEEWGERDGRRRRSLVGDNPDLDTGLRIRSVGQPASEIWERLDQELGLGDAPNFGSSPFGSDWSGNLSLDQYIRLREYARSGESSWLDIPGRGFPRMVSLIDTQISTYSRWASMMGLPIEDFMSAERPEVADVFFVGLVHAGSGGLAADTNGSSLLVEGAVVSQGGLIVENSPGVDFVYNRLYLDDVVRQYRGDPIELDQVYFKIN